MIIVQHSYVSEAGKSRAEQLSLASDAMIEHHARLLRTIRGADAGTVVCCQLNHAGSRAIHDTALDINTMSEQDVSEVVRQFVDAAARA